MVERARHHIDPVRGLLLVSLCGVLLLLLPIVVLLFQPLLAGSDGAAKSAVAREWREPVSNSLLFAAGSALVSVSVGALCAALVVWTDMPGRRLVAALAILPLFFPTLFYSFGWVLLAGSDAGMINRLFAMRLVDIHSLMGMVWVEGHHAVPLTFLLCVGVFKAIPPQAITTARMTGAPLSAVVTRIVLPIVWPVLISAFALVFVRALSAFEVPSIIGASAGINLIATHIYFAVEQGVQDLSAVAAFAAQVMLLSVAILWLVRHVAMSQAEPVSEVATGQEPFSLGRWRWPAGLLSVAWLAVSGLLPLYALVVRSVTRRLDPDTFWQPWLLPGSWSGENYAAIFRDPAIWSVAGRSLMWSGLASLALMALAIMLIWSALRSGSSLARTMIAISHLVFSLPGVIIGLAILVSYGTVIHDGAVLIAIVYCLRGLPYALVYADRALGSVPEDLWTSARMTGAPPMATLRKVLLPLAAPSVMAGVLYVFAISMREVSASILLYNPGQEFVSVYLWQFWQDGELGRFAALSVCMAAFTSALLYCAYRRMARV